MNHKGLNDIVTTVLVILLIVVAVGAIWAFVNPAIKNTGAGLQKGQTCLQNVVEPLNCQSIINGNFYSTSVSVKRVRTQGILSIGSSKLIVDHSIPTDSNIANVPLESITSDDTLTTVSSFPKNSQPKSAIVSTEYILPDSSRVTCVSSPVLCSDTPAPKDLLSLGLMAYWTFEDLPLNNYPSTTGAVVESINNFHGTVKGTSPFPSTVSASNLNTLLEGQSVQLDGDDFIEVPYSVNGKDLNALATGFSIGFWMKQTSDPKLGSYSRIVGKGYDNSRDYGIWRAAGGKILFQQYDSTSKLMHSVNPGLLSQNKIPLNSEAYVLVVVEADGSAKIYINGILDSSASKNAGLSGPKINNDPFFIGSNVLSSASPPVLKEVYQGMLDDIVFFNKPLTAEQVAEIYDSYLKGVPFKIV